MPSANRFALVVLSLASLLPTPAHVVLAQSAPPQPDSTFRSAAIAVEVDVVVRDARGDPVRGLTLADFELREDAVLQSLQAIDAVGAAAAGAAALAATAAARPRTAATDAGRRGAPPGLPPRPGRFVALVFDRLSADARALAYEAALSYVASSSPDDRLGVFVSDLQLETIQDYTSDRALLRQAVRAVATRATAVFDKAALQPINKNPDTNAFGTSDPSIPHVASAEQVGRPADFRGTHYNEATHIGKKPADTLWERMGRNQQGFATTNAIEAIAAGLAAAPGRKALVFFAEGLAIPAAILPQFERAVATANRAHVSVYSVDAKGLRVHSDRAEVQRTVAAIGAASLVVAPDGGSNMTLSNLERNEDALRKDAETSLRLLANRTGGVLINNTNDLSRIAGVVDLDFREHYVLIYQPRNTDFRGEWRRIEVKVPGRRATVRARAGYLAVRTTAGSGPLLAHEARAQAVLDLAVAPTAVPMHVATLTFPQASAPARVALLVSAPLDALATIADGRYDADFTILARIRDASGSVVRTASEPYRVGGPLAGGTAPAGRVLFFRHPELPPGRYGLEVAVADATGAKAGVTRTTFDVPAPAASGLEVSSLVVVDAAEPAGADAANPLISGGRLLYPSLTGETMAGANATLGLFVRLAAPTPATARLELRRDGVALSDVRLALPAADAAGRVDYQAQLPIGALPPGPYQLRLVVTDGTSTVERLASFRRP